MPTPGSQGVGRRQGGAFPACFDLWLFPTIPFQNRNDHVLAAAQQLDGQVAECWDAAERPFTKVRVRALVVKAENTQVAQQRYEVILRPGHGEVHECTVSCATTPPSAVHVGTLFQDAAKLHLRGRET